MSRNITTTTPTMLDDLSAAAEACRDLAEEIVGRSHSDLNIARGDALYRLAARIDPPEQDEEESNVLLAPAPFLIDRDSLDAQLALLHEVRVSIPEDNAEHGDLVNGLSALVEYLVDVADGRRR